MERITKNQVKFVRSLGRKKERDEAHVFLAEGEKCVSELMGKFSLVLRADATNATPLELEQMSQLRAPQGVIAVFRQPEEEQVSLAQLASSELVLALDGVQDPGNLGTIIRTADWFGVHHIFCSRETADCWSPKVVQATMGALARVHVHYVDLPAELSTPNFPFPIYGTLLDGRNIYEKAALPDKQHGVIIMGNEGNGISAELRSLITHPLFIPPYPLGAETSESLNVSIATAVILAEFRRP
ncbi:MAG: RNA methyltransferase [Paludibacteraceae bacterium]|jgi:TrmH family RNA methyltransferase|nr:RNA methyltransferase [Paludibacteraceae bacterium]MBR6146479.1 RNA methyltransferase [Paludibacteraceae bacterium]